MPYLSTVQVQQTRISPMKEIFSTGAEHFRNNNMEPPDSISLDCGHRLLKFLQP